MKKNVKVDITKKDTKLHYIMENGIFDKCERHIIIDNIMRGVIMSIVLHRKPCDYFGSINEQRVMITILSCGRTIINFKKYEKVRIS